MTEDRAHEIAEEEWREKNAWEQTADIDPLGERNLLAEFCEWVGNHVAGDYAVYIPKRWLFEQGEHWRDHRAQQLLEQDLPEYEPEETR